MESTYPIAIAGTLLAAYTVCGAIHRLYLSPVALFPGPKLAALTFGYEFFYHVVKGGRYTWKIAHLHEQYGPIIRIYPFELHVNDPDFYDDLYVGPSKRKTNLWSWTLQQCWLGELTKNSSRYRCLETPEAIIATVDHDTLRRRRDAYSNYFPKQSIRKYGDVIQVSVDKLCLRLREHQVRGKQVNLVHAYAALAGDVVTCYCFPEGYGLLDKPDFAPEFYELSKSVLRNSHLLRQLPWLFPLMLSLPDWLSEIILPDLVVTSRWQRRWVKHARSETKSSKDGIFRPEIFRTLLDSDLPLYDKTASRLKQDAQTLLGGGTETTSRALAVATYYILSNEETSATLMKELATALPNPTTGPLLMELEKLTYLAAVIYETLRMSHGVIHRLQRVSPDQALRYHDWLIPAGNPIGMSAIHIHGNPDIFPQPHLFIPERWLPLETEGRRLNKYCVAFNKAVSWHESRLCGAVHDIGSSIQAIPAPKENY